MKPVTGYFDHDEMCELLDIPKESVLAFENFYYNHADKIWVLRMQTGTQREIEKLVESEL